MKHFLCVSLGLFLRARPDLADCALAARSPCSRTPICELLRFHSHSFAPSRRRCPPPPNFAGRDPAEQGRIPAPRKVEGGCFGGMYRAGEVIHAQVPPPPMPPSAGQGAAVQSCLCFVRHPSPCERCCLMKNSALTETRAWTNESSMRITQRTLSSCQSIFFRTISTEHFWILTLEKFRSYCQPGGLLHLLSQTGGGAWDC